MQALYGRTGLPWSINGQSVRIDPIVRHLVPHESEPGLHAFLQSLLEPGDVVLDVGAFAGIHAIMAARKVGRSVALHGGSSPRRRVGFAIG